MLVDLGRNDIGKISELGSVKVEKYLTVERYSLCHAPGLHSNRNYQKGQRCHRRSGCHLTCRNPFRGTEIPCLPDHSGTGTKQERHLRRCHRICGFQEIWMCIAIRLVYKKKDEICIRSGAGIVADSVLEKEFEECQNKARAVVRAISQAEED